MAIERPWIFGQEPDEPGKVQTLLAGPPGAGYEEFSAVMAGVVKHIAKHQCVSEETIYAAIGQKLKDPNCTIVTEYEAPKGRA